MTSTRTPESASFADCDISLTSTLIGLDKEPPQEADMIATQSRYRPRLERWSGGSIQALKQSPLRTPSPLHESTLVSPPDSITTSFEMPIEFPIMLPKRLDEPLVSHLLRSMYRFPSIHQQIQASALALAKDPEMEGFMTVYGHNDGQTILFVAFLYIVSHDVQTQHKIEAPSRLPRDLSFQEVIGVLHLAELFDSNMLRRACFRTVKELLARRLSCEDLEWTFGRGSRIAGALCFLPEVPIKIAVVDNLTHRWDEYVAASTAKNILELGKNNVEFYMMVKSFCLGHVNDEGINDM